MLREYRAEECILRVVKCASKNAILPPGSHKCKNT